MAAGNVHVAHDGVDRFHGVDDLHSVAGVLVCDGEVDGTVEGTACRVITMGIGVAGVDDELGLDARRLLGRLGGPLGAVVVVVLEDRAKLHRAAVLERNLGDVVGVQCRVGRVGASLDGGHVVGVGQELGRDALALAVDVLPLDLLPLVHVPHRLLLQLALAGLVLRGLHVPL